MKMDIVGAFIKAGIEVLKEISGVEFYKDKVLTRRGKKLEFPVAIKVRLKDEIEGFVLYEIDKQLAVKLTASLLEEMITSEVSREEAKQLFDSALGEIGNMISGRAVTVLHAKGIKIDIETPELLIKKEGEVLSDEGLVVEARLRTIYGYIVISLVIEIASAVPSEVPAKTGAVKE